MRADWIMLVVLGVVLVMHVLVVMGVVGVVVW